MAALSQLVITKKGQALIAKILTGKGVISFTKISASSASNTVESLEELAELPGAEQTVVISELAKMNDSSIRVAAAFTNHDLTTGYYIRTIGLYATDPDEGEILYAATIETSGGCYMPPYNGLTVSGFNVTLITAIGNASSVSMEVNPAGMATVEMLEELKQSIESALSGKQDVQAGKGLSEADYTAAEKQKLSGIADNANNYTHPPHAAKEQGLYLITVDEEGHVSAATAVTKGDITALGIASAEAATVTAGSGISVTQAADGSKVVAQKGARVYVGEDAPDPDEYDIHVW